MLRLVLLISLLWCCDLASGQTTVITKSSDIIVLRGKSYYLHTVQAGQTLYSICKAYGVSVDEVKALNGKKDNTLSLYEVLNVPYLKPIVQQDDKYYYHKVVKGETLYSISRDFGIKPKRVLKFNETYSDNVPLAVGAVVKLPLNEIVKPQEGKQTAELLSAAKKEEATTDGHTALPPENSNTKEKKVKLANPEKAALVAPTIANQEEIEIPEYISEVIEPADPFVKVALLLPLSSKDYPRYDTLAVKSSASVSISTRSEQFIAFYEGMLLAVDSLKSKGYKIDLHVFDTDRNVEKMYEITEQVNRLHPDLIIGPVYGSVYKVMADNLQNKNIPMVYPLSSRNETFEEYPNFVQVSPSFRTLTSATIDWIKAQRANSNVIHINAGMIDTSDGTDVADYKLFTKRMKQLEGVHIFNWDLVPAPLGALRTLLLPDRENIIVLPTIKEAEVSKILPVLSALAEGYRITVIGLPEWQTFTSVDHETYYKLNTKIFTYSYVDNSSHAAIALEKKYWKYFHTEPNSLVYKAFDLGLYFIELAAKYRDRTLDALEYFPANGEFSRFRFVKMDKHGGKENHGLFIVNYSSDYRLKIEPL